MMSPEAFVQLLAEELRVAGVVVGANYRFGYRAAGDAALLQRLGPQYGMQVCGTVRREGRTMRPPLKGGTPACPLTSWACR